MISYFVNMPDSYERLMMELEKSDDYDKVLENGYEELTAHSRETAGTGKYARRLLY
jgi:hypothetical protein